MANKYTNTDPNFYSSNPNDHTDKTFDNWDDIFEFQGRKDGANYSMLKEWLKKYCEVPKLKEVNGVECGFCKSDADGGVIHICKTCRTGMNK